VILISLASGVLIADEVAGVQSTVVDVEVPIKEGNLADAKQAAQKLAFEKAVDQFLPTTMDAKIRAEKIKIATSFIKGFRVVDERQEGGVLKAKVRCDLMGLSEIATASNSSGNSAGASAGQTLQRYEITWRTAATQLNSSEFLDYLKTNQKLNVDSFKMGRGAFWVNILTDRPATDLRTQMNQFLGGLYSIRILEDALPPPAPAPTMSVPMMNGPSPMVGEVPTNSFTPPTNSFAFPAPTAPTPSPSLPPAMVAPNAMGFPKP
jgi:hypothetical protein